MSKGEIFIIVAVVGMMLGLIVSVVVEAGRECESGHVETQYTQPMSYVVNGGVAIPIGNATPKEVFVCDVYKP